MRKCSKTSDILNIDVTVIKTVITETPAICIPSAIFPLLLSTSLMSPFDSMWKGIEIVRPGAHFGDIGYAIQHFVEPRGCSVVQ